MPIPSVAQAPAVQAPIEVRFDIARYHAAGNTLLPPEEIERLLQHFVGRQRDFGDVQRALEALENAYRSRGYAAVQVYLPEQELAKGEITFRVIEARVRRLEVQGNKFFSNANIEASLPSLSVGTTPNSSVIANNLGIVNENSAKQTTVTLRAGEKEGEVDALVDVIDEKPAKTFVTFDNTGAPATGYYRLGIGYQNANLNDRDSMLTLQYITSPDHIRQVGIYSIGYHVPLYKLGGSMDFVAGYSDVNAGTTQTTSGPLSFSGRGGVLGARFNQQLQRIPGYDHKLVWAVDHRMYRNTCALGAFGAAGCGTAGATFSLSPVSLTYNGTFTSAAAQTSLYLTEAMNIGGGAYGDTAALGRARFEAKSRYSITRMGASHSRSLAGDWQVRARLDVQHTNEVLVGPEQFGIGGASSVRGFLERERADDRGHAASAEVYTPELATKFGWKDWNFRLLAFYDLGRTSRVNPQPGEQVQNGIASAGVGLRLNLLKSFNLRLDMANIRDPGGTREANHWRGTFASVITF
jgi:hemolysin activation/secretion protein